MGKIRNVGQTRLENDIASAKCESCPALPLYMLSSLEISTGLLLPEATD